MKNNKYTPVIGLEIHVELKTKSKMFCQCDADYFGKEPNTNTCPVCLGLPGALPVPNRKAIEWTIKIGQALNCTINKSSKFDRKHYFYSDLPKAYQISQYDQPIAVNGELRIDNYELENSKKYRITRVHLEEDTGKLTHSGVDSLVDFNRSSVPLVEIVTEPDFDNSEDVKKFLEELHTIIKYLDLSDANMEEGSMRIEPNISLSIITDKKERMKNLPKYKVEVKNINSFNFAKRAIDFELKRQAKILDDGKTPDQETRGYDEDKGITYSQRSKEDAMDYRYFPEPDIPTITFTEKQIEEIRKTIPELPRQKMQRYIDDYKLKSDDAFILTRSCETASYFEKVISNLIKNESDLNIGKQSIEQAVANVIVNKRIPTSGTVKKFIKAFKVMFKKITVDFTELDKVIAAVISNNPKQIEQYKAGKAGILGFFIGQIMKEMKGQAEPQEVKKKLEEKF